MPFPAGYGNRITAPQSRNRDWFAWNCKGLDHLARGDPVCRVTLGAMCSRIDVGAKTGEPWAALSNMAQDIKIMSKPPFSITSALARISHPDDPVDEGAIENAIAEHGQNALTTRQPRNPQATRKLILDAAFYEIRMAGFAGASINRILDRTGTTKGALYHHFPGKAKLAYAVIEECLPQYIDDVWLKPLDGEEDILPVMMGQVDSLGTKDAPKLLEGGCPLARLASGAAELDENLRKRIDGVYRYWRRGLALHLGHGQFNKTIRTDIEPSSVAEFIIATLHGFLTRPPALRNSETHDAFAREYARYLNGLRP